MSDAADDHLLAEQLVVSGLLKRESLQSCLEIQRCHGGPGHKSLWEILVEQGCLSADDVKATLAVSSADDITMVSPSGTPVAMDMALSQSAEVRQAVSDPTRRIGPYVVLEELGRGGMGVVYRCHDPKLEREVAIKMVVSREGTLLEDQARFQREAMAAAKIRHPGIVAVHEVGEHQGSPYLVMDFVAGETFEDALKRRRLSHRRVVEIVREMALALDHIHDAGICHRDVKPQNVILDANEHPQLMDFGLARDSSARQQLTQTGQVVGTPSYMAPEQVDSESGSQGPWTDVYALGVVLYRALAGELPFRGEATVELFRKILMEDPLPLRQRDASIDADLETVTFKCLEKELDRRYPSAAALAEELQRHLDGQAVVARPMGSLEQLGRWSGRNRSTTLALAALALVVVVAFVAGVALLQSQRRELLAVERAADRRERGLVRASERQRRQVVEERERFEQEAEQQKLEIDQKSRRARSRTQSGDVDGAIADYNRVLELDERFVVAWAARGALRAKKGDLDGAIADYTRVLRLEDREVAAWTSRGALRAQNGDLDGALADYARALEIDDRVARNWVSRGELLYDAGDLAGAIADFTRALEIDPRVVLALMKRGGALTRLGDLDGALADFSRVLEIDSEQAQAWASCGYARLQRGDVDGALADFDRAIEIDPSFAHFWSNRGYARFDRGDMNGAIADASQALQIDPGLVEAWANRGNARNVLGDLDGAIADHSRAIELNPRFVNAWSGRGNVRLAKGDLDGAIADHSRAIELVPEYPVAWSNRVRAKAVKGDGGGAMNDFTRAIELAPDYPMAWYNRGLLRRNQGDLAGAVADWQQFLSLAPNEAKAAAIRVEIESLRRKR